MSLIHDTSRVKRIITSHSLDNVFDYCPRKFEFLAIYDKRPKRESGYAAAVGNALHDGMQAWLVAREEGESLMQCDIKAMFAFIKAFPFDEENQQTQKIRSFENSALMLYEMTRSSEWDDWELLPIEGHGWAVEIPFVIQHSSLGPIYVKNIGEYRILCTQGKIDLVMRHRRTGKIRSIDIKTTSFGPNMIRSNYEFSGQQTGYSHVVHKMAGIAPSNFEVVYAVCMFRSDYPPEIRFITIEKDESDIEDYWLDKLERLERIKRYAEKGRFPRTNGGCNAWNKECAMFDICHTRDPQVVHDWFDFEIETEPNKGYDYLVELEV